jgi:hypothetical protein
MRNLKIPAGINEKTIEFLQEKQSINELEIPAKNSVFLKSKHSRKKVKRLTLIAAIISVLMLMGVSTGYILHTEWIFDAEGNRTARRFRLRQRPNPLLGIHMSDEDREELLFRQEFFGDSSDMRNNRNILGITFYDGYLGGVRATGVGGFNPGRYISNYDEFLVFMQGVDGNIVKLPQYIPDGYVFSEAFITFFVCENFDFETAELLAREEKFGNIYEKWYIPENPANVLSIWLFFEKEIPGDDTWYSIDYRIDLDIPERINSFGIRGEKNSITEILLLPQFNHNLLLSTARNDGRTELTFRGVNAIPIRRGHPDIPSFEKELGTVSYYMSSIYLTRDEIIRMAESIK